MQHENRWNVSGAVDSVARGAAGGGRKGSASGSGWLNKIKQKLLMTERESARSSAQKLDSNPTWAQLPHATCNMQH